MSKSYILPLLSISSFTLVSIGSLIFFKSQNTYHQPWSPTVTPPSDNIAPTQVPKSIEHYLLASQQFFTQALEAQNQQRSPETVTNLLNRSLALATETIRLFPQDYRSYLQRGHIYQSLTTSPANSQIINSAITNFLQAYQLNPSLTEATRTLASLYAQIGDTQHTLFFLNQTVSLEPTKAQNFYDLARLQQQTGLIGDAISTYDQLLTILSDPIQKNKIITEQNSLKDLASQNSDKTSGQTSMSALSPSPFPSLIPVEPLLQADNLPGLIIAAPQTEPKISVQDLTASNSLSDNATLPKGQTSLTIANSYLQPHSQVYLTTLSGGKNLSLEVKSKSQNSFTVGLLDPAPEDIQFKWWIIN